MWARMTPVKSKIVIAYAVTVGVALGLAAWPDYAVCLRAHRQSEYAPPGRNWVSARMADAFSAFIVCFEGGKAHVGDFGTGTRRATPPLAY